MHVLEGRTPYTAVCHLNLTRGSGHLLLSINQSNFYGTNAPDVSRLKGATAESVFNNKIKEAVP